MFFLFPRLEHPAGWICARYKSLLLLLLLLTLYSVQIQDGGNPLVGNQFGSLCKCLFLYHMV